jgi:acetylornithine deacetylase
MRLFAARGIPVTMAGTTGIERAHAVDEHVVVAEMVTVARAMIRAALGARRAAG